MRRPGTSTWRGAAAPFVRCRGVGEQSRATVAELRHGALSGRRLGALQSTTLSPADFRGARCRVCVYRSAIGYRDMRGTSQPDRRITRTRRPGRAFSRRSGRFVVMVGAGAQKPPAGRTW